MRYEGMFGAALALAMSLVCCRTGEAAAAPEPFAVLPDKDGTFHWSPGLLRGTGANEPAAYFLINSTGPGASVWITDGTAAGTHSAADIVDGSVIDIEVPASGGAFVVAQGSEPVQQIFRTDGPSASARRLTSQPEGIESMLGLLDGQPLVVRPAGADSLAAWLVDGSNGSMAKLVEVPTLWPEWALNASGGVVISRPTNGLYQISGFDVDAATPVTSLLSPVAGNYWNYPHASGAGRRLACFKAYTQLAGGFSTQELYCSDGTQAGTRRPVAPALGTGVWIPDFIHFDALGDRLMFITHAQSGPYRPWVTDGTDAGTFALVDFSMDDLTPCTDAADGVLYFSAYSPGGMSLWRTDGTREGTRMLMPIPQGDVGCENLGVSRALDGRAYLVINHALHVSDGTAAGTHVVSGAPPIVEKSAAASSTIVALGRWIVFAARVSESAVELWRLDMDPIFSDRFEN